MCGIAGKVSRGAPVERALIERMCSMIEHRGPDSRGLHLDEGVGLGIQRLRVIDLATGDQPIYNEDRTIAVVLNGEIYNFEALRADLRRKGHTFATAGDTEVIVHLYEEEGVDCVERLHGMFAFALWDAPRRRLLIARDRVGKKPLFYAHSAGSLAFASELRALVQDREIPREVDLHALEAFLAYGYVNAPRSIFSHVRKLPPASTLTWEDGAIDIRRYWRLDYSRKRRFADERELHEEIRATLRRAVRRRMIADVPLGAFLSGGIDSSAVVAAMAEAASEPVRTFSIGFDSAEYNELPHARMIAERFGTRHEEFVVQPDATAILPRLVDHYGEPFADASAIPTYYLSEMTRRHVTVALSGDGGDESFAGYSRYLSNVMASRLAAVPRPLRSAATAVLDRLPESPRMNSNLSRARRLLSSVELGAAERYARQMAYFDAGERRALMTGELAAAIGPSQALDVIAAPWARTSGRAPIDVMLEVDVETYLPGDLLVKMDIASMAHSLEARAPFLDPEMMELAASIPANLKARRLEKKVVLRDALRGWIPDEVLDRPKWGFGIPLGEWLRGDLNAWAKEVLLDPAAVARGQFDPGYVERMIDDHGAGRTDAQNRIWALVVLEHWQRRFLDGGAGAA